MKFKYLFFISVLSLLGASVSRAEVKLPSNLEKKKKIQRNTKGNLWGTTQARKTVTVKT